MTIHINVFEATLPAIPVPYVVTTEKPCPEITDLLRIEMEVKDAEKLLQNLIYKPLKQAA